MKIKDFTTRPIWAEDTWLAKHAGETLGLESNKEGEEGGGGEEEGAGGKVVPAAGKVFRLVILCFLRAIGHKFLWK